MGTAKDLQRATEAYEAWVDRSTPTVPAARADKHADMATGAFPFLRATYYRWAQLVPGVAPGVPGPVVAAIGDLHVENFGTWRDAEGRLVWGVNDLDEADHLPAAYDLLRLAASAEIARRHGALAPGDTDVVGAITAGYRAALATDGRPAVFDRPHPPDLVPLLPASHAAHWWAQVLALPEHPDPPARAATLLARALPAGSGPIRVLTRIAGMGSRDHLRLVGVGSCAGAPVLREVKALAPPASWWAAGRRPAGARVGALARSILGTARHSPDPSLRIQGAWVLRRLAPWADRIELTDLRRRVDVEALLAWMGSETANLHLASTRAADLVELTGDRSRRWLTRATRDMVDAMLTESLAWQRVQDRSGHWPGVSAGAPAPPAAERPGTRSGRAARARPAR